MAVNPAKSEELIADYLRELRVSAWNRSVPREQAASLESEVRKDIDEALAQAGARDEATVYGVLDRLGPPSAFVTNLIADPSSGPPGPVDTLMTPVTRVRTLSERHGWGWAEIVSLLLLIVGPFYVWWIGPIFGILLVRAAANRWTARATHRATNFVAALFAVQALVAVGLFVYVVAVGGPYAEQIQRVFENFALGGSRPALVPGFGGTQQPLSPIQILMASPPYVAGIASGVYLALSPRYRA